MRHVFGGDQDRVGAGRRSWREWLSYKPQALAALAVTGFVGLMIGYAVTALFVFPSEGVGGDLVRVPDVMGRDSTEARQIIERAGLTYETSLGVHHSEPAGTVTAQDPLAEQRAKPGSAVRVTVSLGPRIRAVPDVVGLSREQATLVLSQAGYASELVWVDDPADVGEVVGTEPDAGTVLEVPARVRVRVSAGLRRVQVPDLTSLSLTEARAALERVGLRAGKLLEDTAASVAPGTVVSQDPEAGSEVDRGAEVDLTVVRVAPDTSGAAPDTARG